MRTQCARRVIGASPGSLVSEAGDCVYLIATSLQVLLEGARRNGNAKREQRRKRQYDECGMQTEWQGEVDHPVGPEYSCSLRKIDMMKAVDGREFNNVAGLRCS